MQTRAASSCWADQRVSEEQIREWVERFHWDGFLFLECVLPPELCAELRADLDRALAADPPPPNSSKMELNHRMFEVSRANLRLFDLEPIVSFAEALIDGPCQVIHNNSFRTYPGGGITGWHQAVVKRHLRAVAG